jgi:translation elongation factor EF-Ts
MIGRFLPARELIDVFRRKLRYFRSFAQQTGRSKADAKKALEGSKGDLAEAIMALKE